jgi:hypothetical protein
MSAGLIEVAWRACTGVATVCDQTKIAVTANPIAHIEKKKLRMVTSFPCSSSDTNKDDLVAFQEFSVDQLK